MTPREAVGFWRVRPGSHEWTTESDGGEVVPRPRTRDRDGSSRDASRVGPEEGRREGLRQGEGGSGRATRPSHPSITDSRKN